MIVTGEEFQRIRAQAEAEYPAECCGLVLVREGSPADRRVFPCRNVQDELHANHPANHPRSSREAYKMDGDDLLKALLLEREGYEVRVIYHSHIDGKAYFSPTDKENALGQSGPLKGQPLYPQVTHVVLSVVQGKVRAAAAFVWNPGKEDFVPVALTGLSL